MRQILISLAAAAVLAATGAAAGTVTIGTGSSANAFPFGGTFYANPTTYQQVYAASQFGSAPLKISGLAFTLVSGTVADGTFTLSLSTTTKAVNGLDDINFASNIGAGETQVYSGTLAGQLAGSTLGFTFAPFAYMPADGNLLLNIGVSGVSNDFTGFFKSDSGTAVYSRAHDFGTGTDYGLQTTFTTAPGVPEAGVWLMMITGFGLVGGGDAPPRYGPPRRLTAFSPSGSGRGNQSPGELSRVDAGTPPSSRRHPAAGRLASAVCHAQRLGSHRFYARAPLRLALDESRRGRYIPALFQK